LTGKLTVPPAVPDPDPSEIETLCPDTRACRINKPKKTRLHDAVT
jgi:hypothetical protein